MTLIPQIRLHYYPFHTALYWCIEYEEGRETKEVFLIRLMINAVYHLTLIE